MVLLWSGMMLGAVGQAQPIPVGPGLSALRPPYIISHRGSPGMYIENSMAGFRQTVLLGNPFVEVDCFLLADGSLGVMHDDTLDRTTTGSGGTAAQTRASWQLLRLKPAGNPGMSDDELRVLMLEDVLAEFGNKAIVVIEAKNRGAGAAIVALLQKFEIKPDYVLVNGFDAAELSSAVEAGYPASLNIYDENFAPDPAELAKKYVFVALREQATGDYLQKLRAAGVRYVFYTLDYQYQVKRARERGAAGWYTDQPFYVADQKPMSTDPYAKQSWFWGQLPLAGTERGFFTPPDKLALDSSKDRPYVACLQGWCSPLNTGKPFREMNLRFTVTFGEIQPGGSAGVLLLSQDQPFHNPDGPEVTLRGYRLVIGADGTVKIVRYNQDGPVQIASRKTKAFTAGQSANFGVAYARDQLTLWLFDERQVLTADIQEPPGAYLVFDAKNLRADFSRVTVAAR